MTIIPQGQAAKFEFAIRDDAQRRAILELNFGAAVSAGLKARSLDYGHVQEGLVKAVARASVHLDASLNFTETHDAGLGFGRC